MTAADKIANARALIEPLTEYAPGPWKVDSDGDVYADNSFSIAQIWDIVEDFSEHAETKLILSAPALRDTVSGLADLADAQAQENARLRAENADLKTSVVAFGAVHAVTYAKQWGLPDGHLHPHHYDILEKAGARMVDFTRAALGDAP